MISFFKPKKPEQKEPEVLWPIWVRRLNSKGDTLQTYMEITEEGGLILYDKEGKRHRVITVPLD